MAFDSEAGDLLHRGAKDLGVRLREREAKLFSHFTDLLQLWGGKMNLTSRLETQDIIIYHFLDSLSAYRTVAGRGGKRLIDIGAGAGFPALPLKICLPGLEAHLIESSKKRVSFCREVVRRLELSGTVVLHERGEKLCRKAEYEHSFDWAVVRAVGPADEMLRICLPFLRTGGTAILFKALLEGDELRFLEEEVLRQRASLELLPVHVPFLDAPRTLVLATRCST